MPRSSERWPTVQRPESRMPRQPDGLRGLEREKQVAAESALAPAAHDHRQRPRAGSLPECHPPLFQGFLYQPQRLRSYPV
jgi:hypothetical protein